MQDEPDMVEMLLLLLLLLLLSLFSVLAFYGLLSAELGTRGVVGIGVESSDDNFKKAHFSNSARVRKVLWSWGEGQERRLPGFHAKEARLQNRGLFYMDKTQLTAVRYG